jgi:hypothetical protein
VELHGSILPGSTVQLREPHDGPFVPSVAEALLIPPDASLDVFFPAA